MAKRTAAEAAETRRALLAAGAELFATQGYAAVSAEALVAAAGVTRGALYHHFSDGKAGLFEAVYREVLQRIDDETGAAGTRAAEETGDLWAAFWAGTDRYLELCLDPVVVRIALFEGPVALGWERWEAIDMEFSVAQFAGIIELLMLTGELDEQPIEPLAKVLVGAYNQAGRQIATATDPVVAEADYRRVLRTLVSGLAARRVARTDPT
jgi:AcrR family transcriptional regulator